MFKIGSNLQDTKEFNADRRAAESLANDEYQDQDLKQDQEKREYPDQDGRVNKNEEGELTKQDDVHVNSYFTNDKILLFLSVTEIIELKSLGPKSETQAIGLIGSIMHERVTKQLIAENESKDLVL